MLAKQTTPLHCNRGMCQIPCGGGSLQGTWEFYGRRAEERTRKEANVYFTIKVLANKQTVTVKMHLSEHYSCSLLF